MLETHSSEVKAFLNWRKAVQIELKAHVCVLVWTSNISDCVLKQKPQDIIIYPKVKDTQVNEEDSLILYRCTDTENVWSGTFISREWAKASKACVSVHTWNAHPRIRCFILPILYLWNLLLSNKNTSLCFPDLSHGLRTVHKCPQGWSVAKLLRTF